MDIKGVRQFLGLASFRRFIQNFSEIAAPILTLLRNIQTLNWTVPCETVRKNLVEKLIFSPVLRIYDPNLPCELHTDASAVGLGAVLLQSENGTTRPVAHYSRHTSECESRYHSFDLETLAIVDAVGHFRAYLYRRHFVIYTDCNVVRATALKKDM